MPPTFTIQVRILLPRWPVKAQRFPLKGNVRTVHSGVPLASLSQKSLTLVEIMEDRH